MAKPVKVPAPVPVQGDESKKRPVFGHFKLLSGVHQELAPDGVTRTYKRGQVFASAHDLCAKWNKRGQQARFERVSKNTPSSAPTVGGVNPDLEATYNEMDLEALRNLAADEEIEVGEGDSKELIISKLLAVA